MKKLLTTIPLCVALLSAPLPAALPAPALATIPLPSCSRGVGNLIESLGEAGQAVRTAGSPSRAYYRMDEEEKKSGFGTFLKWAVIIILSLGAIHFFFVLGKKSA